MLNKITRLFHGYAYMSSFFSMFKVIFITLFFSRRDLPLFSFVLIDLNTWMPIPKMTTFQIRSLYDIVPAENGDKFLSMLPPWHVYERACGYFIFSRGIELMYTAVRNLKVFFFTLCFFYHSCYAGSCFNDLE